ncbi:MAG: radical SAM protein [Deltaproteobacteria bacterium]|nr:radical SAM protein [Deltaproteobacteria bacterium]
MDRRANLEIQVATPRLREDRPPFWRGYLLPKLAFLAAGFPKDSFGSIDITNKCNLRCKHCYFFAQDYPPELKDDEWIARLDALKAAGHPLRSCTWVGGEPLLRKNLIERARKYFQFNLVVTNGGFGIPGWRDVFFHVSVDGLEEQHDAIRGKGSYAKLKKTIREASPDCHITIACCINKMNRDCIEPMLEEWYPETNVRGVMFDFFTPIKGITDDLWIPFAERDELIDKLIALKRSRRYRRFIGVSTRALDLMKAKNRHVAVGENCVFLQRGFALDPMGNRKALCMFGPGADCDKCGCIVPFYLRTRVERRYILREMWGDLKGLVFPSQNGL